MKIHVPVLGKLFFGEGTELLLKIVQISLAGQAACRFQEHYAT